MGEQERHEAPPGEIEETLTDPPQEGGFFDGDDEPKDAPKGPSAEEIARQRGWKPPTEWKGAPPKDGFIESPDEFNELYEERMPVVLRENRELHGVITELEQMRQREAERSRREHEREVRDLKAQLDSAVRAGDQRQADQVFEKLSKARDEGPQDQVKPQAQNYDPDADQNFTTWVAENAWYDRRSSAFDPVKAHEAEKVAKEIAKAGYDPQRDGMAFYREVERRVKAKLDKPVSKQDGVSGDTQRRPGTNSRKVEKWSDLPRTRRDDPAVNAIVKRFYKGDRDAYARDVAEDYS